jgi:manganese-dependent inorganic pyrophosphatase
MKHNLIFGHKTPDTDSVCAAITLANLKNKINEYSKPYILGKINKETEFVLKYFNITVPEELLNVKIQVRDLNYDRVKPFTGEQSIHFAYFFMNENKLRTLPIVDEQGYLLGIITMKDIAMSLINADEKLLNTSYDNIIETLLGSEIVRVNEFINGEIIVSAFQEKTLRETDMFNSDSIVIVGDRYDIINYAIEKCVKLIIVTGDLKIPEHLVKMAIKNKVNIIRTPYLTYYTAKNIPLSKYVNSIMKSSNLTKFKEDDYLDDCKEDIENSKHSKFPIVSKDNKYLGLLSRNHLINPARKKVILVDHNEIGQSADGIKQAEIIEVIDHHKIGDIKTPMPISFRNIPVGSTNTIIYKMYKENNIEITKDMAGLMLSGIISDTLLLKSPTTTDFDRQAVNNLVEILDIDLYSFAMEMFVAGTSLEGKTREEIIYQDFKSFNLENNEVGISQVFTMNINEIMNRKDEYIKMLNEITKNKNYYLMIMAVTDIINEGSYMFYTSSKGKLISYTFEKESVYQGIFIDKCVSRKKQIVPNLINAIRQLN